MGVRTIVAVAFFVMCAVVMKKVFWMLDQCVPASQEPESKAEARRWKIAVAAVVVAAWICAAGIALGLDMPKSLCVIVFAGPFIVSLPALVWVMLVY